jgi:hypothetical protein
VAGDQFYVTHCTTADSVMNAPGYSVRAASAAGDPDVLKRALEYPPYELPLDMWREKPPKANTPRRLARTKHPGGGVWVVHSVYLEKDTMNRDRSYFSHLIALPASADAASVLESWDAEGWVKEYPQGATKTLRKCPLPRGEKISRKTLTQFLAGAVAGPADVASTVCPTRLRASADARRVLVGRFLKGVILTHQARAEGEGRDRFFVHGEPGLVAMLLYAAARILPPVFSADLTFSTFEPSHRSIRDFRLGAVVGTYLGLPGKGLDPDLVTAHGYGLDTVYPDERRRSSPELAAAAPLPEGLAELIDLAANGEWGLLEAVHRCIGSGPESLAEVPLMIPLARAAARLEEVRQSVRAGERLADGVSAEDLLALKADRRGEAILKEYAPEVWDFLKDAALSDPALRAAFRDWLADPERLTAYRREACEALAAGDFDGWDVRWGLVRDVADPEQARQQADKAQKTLDRQLPTLPMAARDRLRSACAASGAWPDHHLLAPTSPDELNALLAASVPADWQGYTCFAVMGPDEKNWLLETTRPYRAVMRDRVRKHLFTAPTAVLAGYLHHAKDFVTVEPGFLYDLLRPYRPECRAFLSRLIDAGADTIDAGDWTKLLGELDIYGQRDKNWEGFLLKSDHLAKLLGGFKASPAATPVWGGYLDLLSGELVEGDEWEANLYAQLDKARRTLGASGIALKDVAPPGGARKLKAADTLLAVSADASVVESQDVGQLTEAFQVFGIEPLDGLRKIYLRGKFDAVDLNRETGPLEPFVAAFRACYPVTHEYYTARTAVTQWLALSESCPEATRAAFQAHFVREYVPVHWYRDLLGERPRISFHPEAEARIREALAAVAKKPGEQYTRPAGGQRAESESDAVFDSPATRRAKRSRGSGRSASARRRNRPEGVPPWVWLVVVGIVVLVVLALAIAKLTKKPEKPAPQDTSPPPAAGKK